MVEITARYIDDLKILPRLMMLAVTILTYQSVHWFMSIPHDQVNAYNAGLVSVCMGAFTGCFGIWLGKESRTDRAAAPKVKNEANYNTIA
ncbi:MAG: hypothetical protein VW270_24130, partial [Candidatus Poseidoniales archaeon]